MTETWHHISDVKIVHVASYLGIFVKCFAFLKEARGKESGRAHILGYRELAEICLILLSFIVI